MTVLLYAVFKLLRINDVTFTAFQKPDERNRVIDQFNGDEEEAMVLIMTYAVGSIGLNLQYRCWNAHVVESAHNLGTLGQAVGRARRLGNPSPVVHLYECYVAGTFDDKMVWQIIENAIPEAMAQLNRSIFRGEDETGYVNIGEWVFFTRAGTNHARRFVYELANHLRTLKHLDSPDQIRIQIALTVSHSSNSLILSCNQFH